MYEVTIKITEKVIENTAPLKAVFLKMPNAMSIAHIDATAVAKSIISVLNIPPNTYDEVMKKRIERTKQNIE
jgi:hypothetical protein